MAVKKPRAKKAGKDVELHRYRALQGLDLLQEKVLNHMMSGVATEAGSIGQYEPVGKTRTASPGYPVPIRFAVV